MSFSRVFVSYVCLSDEAGARVGRQLLNDIRATGTEAVADHETITDERFMPFLLRELPQCGRLIVVQTPQALQSWRMQSTLSLASTLMSQRQLQAIRVIATPSEDIAEPPLWTALASFDADVDYLRMREKIFLVLGLTRLDASDSFVVPLSFLSPPLTPSVATNGRPSPQMPGARPGAGGNVLPKVQASLPVSMPVTPAPVPPAVRANVPPSPAQMAYWPQQTVTPAPLPQPGRTNWPYPSPESQPGLVTAQALARTTQQKDQSGSALKRIWLRMRAFVAGLSKTSKLQP